MTPDLEPVEAALARWPDVAIVLDIQRHAESMKLTSMVARVAVGPGWQHTDGDVDLRRFLVAHMRLRGWVMTAWRVSDGRPHEGSSSASTAYASFERRAGSGPN